ncbi:MAG: adenylate/guanylate cyclase domain-containing protein [Pseudomonadota bacterium]
MMPALDSRSSDGVRSVIGCDAGFIYDDGILMLVLLTERMIVQRRLAAILVADVVGYSRLMEVDEEGTLAALQHRREQLINPSISTWHGRIVKLMGDGVLAEFKSVVDAVSCAAAIQRGMAAQNEAEATGPGLELRIGINLGDVIVQDDDIYGDGVNVAARLEGAAAAGSICIARSVYDQVRHRLDLTYQDLGALQVKGLQEPVHAYAIHIAEHQSNASGHHPPPPRPEDARGSIVVLPFESLSTDTEDMYLADGIATEIVAMLSQVPDLRVISHAASTGRRQDDPWRAVGGLGARYVLTGNVRRAGERVRVFVELAEAADRSQLWSATYDRRFADLFDLQDDIAEAIVVAFGGELLRAEWLRASKRATDSLDAWGLVQKAKSMNLPVSGRAAIDEALGLAARAVESDPQYAGAHACFASILMQRMINRHGSDPEQDRHQARAAIERAVELAPNDPAVLRTLGNVMSYCGQHQKAVDAFRRSVAIAPFDFHSWGRLGRTLAYGGDAGELEEGHAILDRILAHAPSHPMVPYWLSFKANAYAREHHYEEAARFARKSVDAQPGYAGAWLTLAYALDQLGRSEEAREAKERARRANPAMASVDLSSEQDGAPTADRYVS